MVINLGGLNNEVLNFHLAKTRQRDRMIATSQKDPAWGSPYPLSALLNSDYIVSLDLEPHRYERQTKLGYSVASARFLHTPPAAFAETHRRVATFELPIRLPAWAGGGWTKVNLIKRIRPLTIAEATASIAALEIAEKHKTEKDKVLAKLYAQAGESTSQP
jgi:hypothetical protein